MLKQIDLSRTLKKADYKREMDVLSQELARLQRRAIRLKIPIIIVFEGWSASGKGTLINELILTLDPRHFKVYTIKAATEEERFRPYLWRFWTKTPAKGRMAIFDRSWYNPFFYRQNEEDRVFHGINNFERQLTDSGYLIIKFFFHLDKKEQKRRFLKLESNAATAWRVTKTDWKKHKKYNDFIAPAELALSRTDTANAPWTIVEANNRRFASVKMFKTVARAMQQKILEVEAAAQLPEIESLSFGETDTLNVSILDGVDLSATIARDNYRVVLKKYQARIRELEHEVYKRRIPVVICYEGWDAAGKGGNIKRLTENMDPRGYDVIPIAAPNDIEKRHHYLWRFWQKIPKAGHIAIFDRTWYGRVMVERIEGFCTPAEWKRAYREINEFEEHLLRYGTILVKFWLHIDPDEQLRRFEERKHNPDKKWKLTDEDWRNREKWGIYQQAVDEMLFRTSPPGAPWTIVEANSKYYARLKALQTTIAAIEAKLKLK